MSRRAPTALLAVALVASAALLFSLASDLIFVGDSWELLAGRPDWSAATFLEPFNEHAILIHAFVFKALLSCFGMDSALPFFAVSISLFLLCGVLTFVYVRRRVGDWLALGAAVLLLFIGAAYEDLLWEFQLCFFGSIAAGLGAFLALDRGDRKGDWIASMLLVVAIAFSSLGVPFILAAAVRIALDPPPRRRRALVPLVPLALYGLWWLFSEHSTGGQLGLADIPDLPAYLLDVAAAGLASLLGQQPLEANGRPPLLAQVPALALVGLLVFSLLRGRRVPPGLVVALVLLFSFWVLLALDRGPQRFSSRFQYPSAVFILLVAAEALRGRRVSRPVAIVLTVVAAAAVFGGVSLLVQGRSLRQSKSDQIGATLAALELAGSHARPSYSITFPPSITLSVAQYRDAERKHGTPALSEAQLLDTEEFQRQVADWSLVDSMDLRLRPARSGQGSSRCRRIAGTDGPPREGRLSAAGDFRLENGSRTTSAIGLRRFSDEGSTFVGVVPPGEKRTLHLPADASPQPWKLTLEGGPIEVCAG